MGIAKHLTEFAGIPVKDYEPGKQRQPTRPCAWRLGSLAFGKERVDFTELLGQFLDEHDTRKTTALVIGAWNYDDMVQLGAQGTGAARVVEALLAARNRLPAMKHLFFGDITSDECEISWIRHGDISALLPAFPKLEEFAIRGTGALTFGKLRHPRLKRLAIESGGIPATLLEEVSTADLPKLEHLELWLGSPDYDGIADATPLATLLSGQVFRKLKYLGLRNSECADEVAQAVVRSPLLKRLHTLDLSLGNLSDVGAKALLECREVRSLKRLDLHRHFLSDPFVEALKEIPIEVDVSDQVETEFHTYDNVTAVCRYNAVAE